MLLFAFAALGTQAAAGTVSVSYELNGETVSFTGATLREVNDKMRTYWEVSGDGCAYNAAKLPADGTGTLTWTVSGTVEQGDYLNEGALVLPSLSGGYIYRDGTYQWKKIEVKAAAPGATIISPTFDVHHSYLSTGIDTTTVTGVTLQGGLYVVPHGTVTFDGCTFTGQLRVPNGDGAFAVTGCTFTGTTAAQDSNGYVMHYQAAGTLAFTGNTVANGYKRGLNIDNKDLTATVEKNKLGTTKDAGRSAIQISTCVKLAVTENEIKLNGGNAITLHENLLTLSAAPEVSISGNTVTGTGYLIYDDAKANNKEFTSDSLKLTYATDNVVATSVDTKKGVKGSTEYALSETVATTLHSVDFAAFVDALTLTDAGYTFDGSKHARAQNGKLTVKWSPVSGCYDKRGEGHDCTVGNVIATANTPKRVNSGLTQFQLFEGESHAVNVKNVAFVYEPAAFTVCENSDWKGTFTAEQAPAGQIYLMNTGNVTFEGCSFDKVVLTSFNCTGTSTVKGCSFKNVYNSYAVKDIRGANVAVTGCTFEKCGAAVMVSMESSTFKVGAVTISGNTFTKVDVAGTTPDNKVGTRGLVQIASSGDYADTAFDFSGNKATDCGPVLRQLNSTVSFDADDKTNLGNLVSDGGASAFYTDDTFVAQVGDTKYATLAEAFAALSAGNHTLALLKNAAWNAATPVYWTAGAQSGYAATLTAALTAAYRANKGAITIVCRPDADVGTMTHGHVADDLTIYGNNAFISDGECDLEVDTYAFSRTTGAQATDGAYLEKDITITAYELDNLGVWGERHTDHTVTVNLTDCDGKAPAGNVQRVYISGTTGVNDITLTGCDFLTTATAVYSNVDGAIKAVNCSFTGGQVPFNINHKANGTQTVAVENCTFTTCGDNGQWKQFAAPLRLVNSGAGTLSAEVTGCKFKDTVGANGDILLGDGRTGQASKNVELKVVNTAANIQAQKPGYYGGETVDETKKATATSLASGTLETSVAKLLPGHVVDENGNVTISDEESLFWFAEQVNVGRNTFAGKTVSLAADITLTADWTPVGVSVANSFKGTFDGKNHKITGLNVLGSESEYVGLIGVLDGGTVKNVQFASVDVSGGTDAGTAVGRIINGGTVDNVKVLSGTVSGSKRVGGVVGSIKACGTVKNCENAAKVEASTYNVGGIVGAAYYTETGKEMYITDCRNTADITSAGVGAGGIVGLSCANVSGNTNTGAVKGKEVGGIVGEQKTYGSVTGNTNSGAVTNTGTGTDNWGTGGIIGWLRYHGTSENSAYPQSAIITVSGNSNSATITGANDAGGIVGVVYNSAVITDNSNTAETLSGTTFAAGIVGNYQITEIPAAVEPAKNKLTFTGNTSTTTLDNITANNKDLLIYDNRQKVAQIGDKKYATLEDAVEAAKIGDTITIIADDASLSAPKGWTISGSTLIPVDKTWRIANLDQLKEFQSAVNGGNTFDGQTVVLDADIDMASEENWQPVGNASEKKFAGTFDGQNHTISGLTITGGSYVGLFGYLGAATVQNVALVGANVSGVKRVGALVGQIAGNATIQNCSLDETSSVTGSDSNTGGLIGEASGSIVVTLENLTNDAPVTNTESGTSRAAGILCQATSGASVTLKNCVNKGTITTNGGYAGGIVSAKQGGASLVFDGCSNTGTLANGTNGTGALLAWSCNGSSVTISNYSGDVANAIGWLSQDNYDHVFVINGIEHYIRVAKGGSGYTFASRYEAAQPMDKSYLLEIIGFFNYAKTVNANFAGYPATPVEVLKSAYNTRDESIKGGLFNTDTSSGWPQLLSQYNATSGKSLTADNFSVTWGTRDVLFMVGGVVVTDTASAQAALDTATPNTTIIFKAGTYGPLFIRQTLEMSTRREDLDKDGSYPAYLRSFKNLTLVAEEGAEVVSKGITAEAGLFWHATAPASNQAEMNRATSGFISYLALENVTIDGIAFDSSEQSAVTLRDNGAVATRGNIMVDGLTIQNCTGRGVVSNKNIHFLAAGAGTNDQNFPGTEKKAFNNLVVKNCILDSYYQPIAFNNATAVLNGLTVTGNTFSNNGNSNVLQLSNKVNSGAFVIENNLFKDLNGRVVRATTSTANWTITGNRLDKPIMYDDSGELDLVKINVMAETVGTAVTESNNDWNPGTLANGTYIANGDPALLPVAKIGDTYYWTLAEAVAAAKIGDTITLLKSSSGNGIVVPSGSNFTVDFAGYTYTVNTDVLAGSNGTKNQAFQLLKDSTITFKNGAIVADNVAVKMLIQNYANLTLEKMTLDAKQGNNSVVYVLSTNNGSTTITDTTITAKVGGVAFDACTFGSYTGNTVTMTGTSVINGAIEVSAANDAPVALHLNAGTINGAIVMAGGSEKAGIVVTKTDAVAIEAPAGYKWVNNALTKKDYVASITDGETTTKYETLQAAFDAAFAAGPSAVEVEILSDITLTDWTPVNFDSYPANMPNSVTIKGNGHVIKGLTKPLVEKTWTGTSLEFDDLTISDANIDVADTGSNGVGAFIGFVDSTQSITLKNCSVANSSIKGGHWCGGLIGYCCGYSNTNDGAVFTTVTLENCKVDNTTVMTTTGSAGALIGHATGSAWTKIVVTGDRTTVTDNTIVGENAEKTGVLFGTVGAGQTDATNNKNGGIEIVHATVSGNVTKYGDSATSTDPRVFGRIATEGGTIAIKGGSFKDMVFPKALDTTGVYAISGGTFSSAVPEQYCAEGFIPTENGNGTYGVQKAVHVVAITLGGEPKETKEMPFPITWLKTNIDADASKWTTEELEKKGANGLAKWQCYLFGLDPKKEDAKVVATAGQGTDEAIPLAVANADASASPLVTGGYVTVAYVLMGSDDRTAWTEVKTSNKQDGLAIPLTGTTYRFYRVDVTVTSAEGN